MTACERKVKNWYHEPQNFDSLVQWLQAISLSIHCVSEALSENPHLSADEVQLVSERGRAVIQVSDRVLRTISWQALTSGWRTEQCEAGLFLHLLSYRIDDLFVRPLTALCEDLRGCAVAPAGIVDSLKDAWAAAKTVHPLVEIEVTCERLKDRFIASAASSLDEKIASLGRKIACHLDSRPDDEVVSPFIQDSTSPTTKHIVDQGCASTQSI